MKESYSKPMLEELGGVSDITAANLQSNQVDLPFGTTVPPGTVPLGSV